MLRDKYKTEFKGNAVMHFLTGNLDLISSWKTPENEVFFRAERRHTLNQWVMACHFDESYNHVTYHQQWFVGNRLIKEDLEEYNF